jgi:hypothetical protein
VLYSAVGAVLAPATAPGDERGCGEAREQRADAADQQPVGTREAGLADAIKAKIILAMPKTGAVMQSTRSRGRKRIRHSLLAQYDDQ